VFWRRVAAGLNEARQMELLEDVAGHMHKAVQQNTRGKSSHGSYDDMLRLFAAMEAVPWQYRQEMGQWMLQRLRREDETVQTWWAIGRLAARQSLAANAHLVMPPEAALEFLNATLAQDWRKNETAMFAAVQMARMTGDRARDLPDEIVRRCWRRCVAAVRPSAGWHGRAGGADGGRGSQAQSGRQPAAGAGAAVKRHAAAARLGVTAFAGGCPCQRRWPNSECCSGRPASDARMACCMDGRPAWRAGSIHVHHHRK
jgi:hypothetical protein